MAAPFSWAGGAPATDRLHAAIRDRLAPSERPRGFVEYGLGFVSAVGPAFSGSWIRFFGFVWRSPSRGLRPDAGPRNDAFPPKERLWRSRWGNEGANTRRGARSWRKRTPSDLAATYLSWLGRLVEKLNSRWSPLDVPAIFD